MLIALVAGILGSSRLTLDAHTKSQVYVGFLVGFFVEIIYLAFIVKPYFLGIA
jgi:membrane-associated phospholipid phosphatase